jgi:hypothetical protein
VLEEELDQLGPDRETNIVFSGMAHYLKQSCTYAMPLQAAWSQKVDLELLLLKRRH